MQNSTTSAMLPAIHEKTTNHKHAQNYHTASAGDIHLKRGKLAHGTRSNQDLHHQQQQQQQHIPHIGPAAEAAKTRWNASVDHESGAGFHDAKIKFIHTIETEEFERHQQREEDIHNKHLGLAPLDGVISPEVEEVQLPQHNEELIKVISRVQELTHHFSELTGGMDGRNAQLARVLTKLRARYVNCFEQLLAVTSKMQAAKEADLKRKTSDLQVRERETQVRIMTLESDQRVLRAQTAATELVVRTQNERIEELEDEVLHLRTLLRGESQDLLKRSEPLMLTDSLVPAADRSTIVDFTSPGTQDDVRKESIGVELSLEQPLQALDTLVNTFEQQGETKQLILSNMEKLLEVAEENAKRNKATDAKFMAAKLRGKDVELVEMRHVGTMTNDANTLSSPNNIQDIVSVSRNVHIKTLWWKAFNLARCPRCKVEVQKEVTTTELLELEKLKTELETETKLQRQREIERVKAILAQKRQQSPRSPQHLAVPGLESSNAQPTQPSEQQVVSSSNQTALAEVDSKNRSMKKRNKQKNAETQDIGGVEQRLSVDILVRVMNSNKNNFELPSEVARFLVNLPQSIMDGPVQTLPWLLDRISTLYDEKLVADQDDIADGLPLQTLGAFTIEQFLFRHGLRRIAEIRFFELLQSVRAHIKKHARVKVFARFLDAYHCKSPEDRIRNNNILQVFLQVRDWLLRPQRVQQIAKLNTAHFEEDEADCIIPGPLLLENEVAGDIIEHEECTYVPLERAIKFLRIVYSTFLPPRKVNMYCRAVENLAAVHSEYTNVKGIHIKEVRVMKGVTTGDRTTVRMQVRNAMLQSHEGNEQHAPRNAAKRIDRVVVDLDRTMESLIKVLVARERHVGEKLRQLFIRGDTDGDGVLSFKEFTLIVKSANANFSSRKILRMFREASTSLNTASSSSASGLALTPEIFQNVCQAFDVVPLLDFEAVRAAAAAQP